MVKANFSFGGKLLLLLVTVIIYTFVLIGGIIGGALYAYNNVKVGELLDLIGQTQLVSKEYAEKTIQQFVADIQKELSGDGLTLQKIIDISPQAGDMINDVLDNVDQNGIITIDRDTLFGTPVQELASSLMDIAVVSATLGSLQDTMGVTLPDMPVIAGGAEGSEVWLYSAANQNEEQTLDKAFLYGDYTYYTKAEQFSEEPVATPETVSLYSLPKVTEDEDGSLRSDGRLIYRKVADGRYEKLLTSSSYVRKTENDYLFATDELYRKGDLGSAADSYVRLTSTPAGEEKETPVPMKYRYQPLYLEDGNLATEGPNAETGQYTVIGDYQGESLYAMEDVYTEVAAENLENGVPKDDFLQENIVYVKSNGLTELPVLNAVNALSAVFDMETLTLRMAGEYFGVDLEVEMLDDVLDVPLAYIGSSVDETVQNIELGTALGLDGDSDPLLLFLAYGEEGIDYTIDTDNEIVPINPPKTIANVTDSIDTITIGNLIGVEEDSADILIAIQDWTLADFRSKDKIESLTLDDILGIDENDDSTAAILKALKDVPIGKLETTIETLSLQEMLGEEITPENNILWALKDCTLSNLGTVMQSLSLQDLFADDLYGYVYIGTAQEVKDDNGTVISEKYDARYEQLFVWENLEYTEKTADEIKKLPADTKIYARYILAYYDGSPTAKEYENIPLYAYVPNTAEGEPQYVLATRIAYTLPQLPQDVTAADLFAKDDAGNFVAPVKDKDGYYIDSVLYYLGTGDKAVELPLIPDHHTPQDGFEDNALYSMVRVAQKAVVDDIVQDYYTQANLYYVDTDSLSIVRIPVVDNPETDRTAPYLEKKIDAEENIIGYIVHNVTGTVYTHGDTQGIWKYLLTNENGAEEIASLNDIGSLMSNITYNINNKTLGEMRDDGVLEVPVSADGSDPLATEIPEILLSGTKKTLGDMAIKDLLDLTTRALELIQQLENNPKFDWGDFLPQNP